LKKYKFYSTHSRKKYKMQKYNIYIEYIFIEIIEGGLVNAENSEAIFSSYDPKPVYYLGLHNENKNREDVNHS